MGHGRLPTWQIAGGLSTSGGPLTIRSGGVMGYGMGVNVMARATAASRGQQDHRGHEQRPGPRRFLRPRRHASNVAGRKRSTCSSGAMAGSPPPPPRPIGSPWHLSPGSILAMDNVTGAIDLSASGLNADVRLGARNSLTLTNPTIVPTARPTVQPAGHDYRCACQPAYRRQTTFRSSPLPLSPGLIPGEYTPAAAR